MQPDDIARVDEKVVEASAAAAYMAVRCLMRGRDGTPLADPTAIDTAPLEWHRAAGRLQAYLRSNVRFALEFLNETTEQVHGRWQGWLKDNGWEPSQTFYFAKLQTPALLRWDEMHLSMRDQLEIVVRVSRAMAKVLS
jgi:hypothetical protein